MGFGQFGFGDSSAEKNGGSSRARRRLSRAFFSCSLAGQPSELTARSFCSLTCGLERSAYGVAASFLLQSEARWVRLSGETCLNEFKPDSIRVKNLTNGYVATTFRPENGQLTTDYIPLESGKNDLLVRFEQGNGVHSENHITVTR